MCLLRGTDWTFKQAPLILVFKEWILGNKKLPAEQKIGLEGSTDPLDITLKRNSHPLNSVSRYKPVHQAATYYDHHCTCSRHTVTACSNSFDTLKNAFGGKATFLCPVQNCYPLALELDIYSLSHHLCKMWIFYEPRRVALGNTRHFVEELTEDGDRKSKKIIKYICWLNI